MDVTIDAAVAPKVLPRGQDAATHRDDRHRAKSRASNRRLVGVYGLRVCQSATPGQSVPLTAGPTTPRGTAS